jgi:hypothetical protein
MKGFERGWQPKINLMRILSFLRRFYLVETLYSKTVGRGILYPGYGRLEKYLGDTSAHTSFKN